MQNFLAGISRISSGALWNPCVWLLFKKHCHFLYESFYSMLLPEKLALLFFKIISKFYIPPLCTVLSSIPLSTECLKITYKHIKLWFKNESKPGCSSFQFHCTILSQNVHLIQQKRKILLIDICSMINIHIDFIYNRHLFLLLWLITSDFLDQKTYRFASIKYSEGNYSKSKKRYISHQKQRRIQYFS